MQVRNPRNGELDYTLKVDDAEKIFGEAAQLKIEQTAWAKRSIDERVQILLKFADKILENKDELIDALSIDTGRKTISEIEFQGAVGVIKGRCYSSPLLMNANTTKASVTSPGVEIRQQWVPYPLVGIISPWNFPLLLALIDTVPALLAGCTVLLKPSEVTPRFIDPLEKIVEQIPELAAVLKFVRGGVESGKAIVDASDVICFTGSVPTGRKIAARCAERFIPAFLELGGKDPAIVLEDADLELTTEAIMRSAAGATGQACQSLERIYVHENIASDLLERLIKVSNATSFNNDYEKGGTMGPLIFHKQAEHIEAQLQDAVAKGAVIHTGGKIESIQNGLWMMPTVMSNVNHEMDIMNEETFGPVIPVMSFSNTKEAIEWCNNSIYGLSASVFSKDLEKAIEVAEQIESGGISINDASLTNKVFDATKNSFKQSGLNGSRMGNDGFLRFFRKKALMIQNGEVSSIFEQSEKV